MQGGVPLSSEVIGYLVHALHRTRNSEGSEPCPLRSRSSKHSKVRVSQKPGGERRAEVRDCGTSFHWPVDRVGGEDCGVRAARRQKTFSLRWRWLARSAQILAFRLFEAPNRDLPVRGRDALAALPWNHHHDHCAVPSLAVYSTQGMASGMS